MAASAWSQVHRCIRLRAPAGGWQLLHPSSASDPVLLTLAGHAQVCETLAAHVQVYATLAVHAQVCVTVYAAGPRRFGAQQTHQTCQTL